MLLLQPVEFTNGIANCDGFNISDFAEDFDIFSGHNDLLYPPF